MLPPRTNYGISYGSRADRSMPYVGDMWTQLDVLTALGSEQMMSRTRTIDPERAKAIFISYINCKLRKGKPKADIAYKVEDLERGLPHLARSFQEARAATHLPPSRLFPPLSAAPVATASPPSIHRTTSAATPLTPSTPTRMTRAHTTTARPTQTIRPAADPQDEPPPPPYSRQDPDPEATRILQEQLAAAVEQAGPSAVADDPAEERERRELEEAMRLSLQAERQVNAGRSSEEDRAARRISSPVTEAAIDPPTHRRTVSDAARPTESLNRQMDQMHIPGGWQETPTASASASANGLAPPLSPIRTGSNNPFARAISSPSTKQTTNPFADPPKAGTSRTIYAPPPGPPPGHPAASSSSAASSSGAAGNRGNLQRILTQNGGENPLEMLRRYDTVILVDDSGSMAGGRWKQAKSALMDLAEQAAVYDEDGIDIYMINSTKVGMGLTTASQVEQLFDAVKPGGSTPTGLALEKILLDYMHQLEQCAEFQRRGEIPRGEGVKPMNLIVITDGAPTDDPESVLITVAKRLDRGNFPLSQLGVQFLQIGNETEAREALQELDDALSSKHGVRDMVDTVPYNGEAMDANLIVKALLGGINRRMDGRDL